MKYLYRLLQGGIVLSLFIILLFTIRIIALDGIVDQTILLKLHFMMRDMLTIPVMLIGIGSLVMFFVKKGKQLGKQSWMSYICNKSEGKRGICLTLSAFVIVVGLQFYRYLIGLFLAYTTL